jgi:predicted acylesterase/phospholipase RssA
MYYDDAPEKFQKIRLGYAVGASSCVPVMFSPLPMKGLYPDLDLELVDGGVHDNQGIGALLEQECNNMIVSDASGQMPTSLKGESTELQMFYRADTILQERVRELQFRALQDREYTSMLSSLLTVHLKSDLQASPLSWAHCIDPSRTVYESAQNTERNRLTRYGILRTTQQQLSELRTDLDSFNDTEAYALMCSGYQQMEHELDMRSFKNSCAILQRLKTYKKP